MKALYKTFVLLLASIALTSCGGGGGGSHSALGPPGNDTSISLSAAPTTLPLCQAGAGSPQCDFFGSPFISEVTVTWRHNNGQLVSGTSTVNVSVTPVNTISFSKLLNPGETAGPTDSFHALEGSGFVNVTAGVGTIFIHADNVPGSGVLSVTAIDPVSNQTLTAQTTIIIAGAATGAPASVFAGAANGVYISGSNGAQSTILTAQVLDGSNAAVPSPNGFNNVQFQIIGPANSDARLSGTSATGGQVAGTTVDTATHNGIATVTFQSGTQQGPVQVKISADRSDNNVDNGITDPVTATATVVVSDGKLYSLTIDAPDADTVTTTGVSTNAIENPAGSGNYQLAISAKGVDFYGNPVLPGTVVGFGDLDAPQIPKAGSAPQNWFLISGSRGDPHEGTTAFNATDGKFTGTGAAGGGVFLGDTLLVFGKEATNATMDNTDLESAQIVRTVNSPTSLTVATPFNLNDRTGVIKDYLDVIPYVVGRATFSSVQSPAFTDATSSDQSGTGVAVTTLNYPASAIGKAVAIWAQGTGTNTHTAPGQTEVVADIKTLVFPGLSTGAILTASPDPILGNSQQFETVCYYDGNGRPIANFDINFSYTFAGVGSGSADGVSNAGYFQHLTGANGCVTVSLVTASLPAGTGSSITFSVGPVNASSTGGGSPTTVTVPIVVNAAQLQIGCAAGTPQAGTPSPGTDYAITLRLLDSAGAGLPGETITGVCIPAGLSVSAGLPTDASGSTTAIIHDTGSVAGTCSFQSSSFSSLVASVKISGTTSSCSGGFSPGPN